MNTTEPYKAESEEADLLVADGNRYQLVVWNDEVNTFQWEVPLPLWTKPLSRRQ